MSINGAVQTITDPTTFCADRFWRCRSRQRVYSNQEQRGQCRIDGLDGDTSRHAALFALASLTDGSFSLREIPDALNSCVQNVSFVVSVHGTADIAIGIGFTTDTSPSLGIFFDLVLHNWDIHVGFPADWCTNADAILAQIRTARRTDNSKANQLVKGTITKAFEGPPLKLDAAVPQKLLRAVPIQFTSRALSAKLIWPLSDTSDKTIVIVP